MLQDFFFLALKILSPMQRHHVCTGISEHPVLSIRTNWSALNLTFEGSVEESLLRIWTLSETCGRWDYKCVFSTLGSRSVGLFFCLQDDRISRTFCCWCATLCTLWGLNVCLQSGGALVCSSALDPGQSPGQSPGHGGRGHFDFTGGTGGFPSLAWGQSKQVPVERESNYFIVQSVIQLQCILMQ